MALPLYHAAATPLMHTSVLRPGYTAVILRRYDLPLFLRTIEEQEATDLLLVPPIVLGMVKSPLTTKKPLRSLKAVACSAAALGPELQADLQALLPDGTPITQV
jgi:4-coumarate--CoA ligase